MALETVAVSPLHLYIGMAISGIFTGTGVAIGTYIANRYIISHSQMVEKKFETKIAVLQKRLDETKKKFEARR
jgi:hypothetical protein